MPHLSLRSECTTNVQFATHYRTARTQPTPQDTCFVVSDRSVEHTNAAWYTTLPTSLRNIRGDFPHKNMLIYLNDSDGDTVCGNDRYSPKEDAIIEFEGEHYHYLPSKDKRVVLVVTYI